MIHIEQLIRHEHNRRERTPHMAFRKIICVRPNVYYIFSQLLINTDFLLRISQVLNLDFFKYNTTNYEIDTS